MENSTEEEDSIFTCLICIEPISKSQQFKTNAVCDHPVCIECASKYIELKIKDKTGRGNIACPGLHCKTHLDPLLCRDIISKNLFVEWCDFMCEKSISWPDSSYCPNPSCKVLVVNECGDDVKKSNCPNCKQQFCFQCKEKWECGRDHQCRVNAEIRGVSDVLFAQLMMTNRWVKCPGCGLCIERLNGCAQVTCRCSTNFCYLCGREICGCKPDYCSGFGVIAISLVFILEMVVPFWLWTKGYIE